MGQSVSCVHLEKYQVQVRTKTHSWIADEPVDQAGDGLGPAPFELLTGALGVCTTITVYHRAAKAGIPIENLYVDVDGEWQGEGDDKTYHISVTIRVRGDLNDDDLDKIRRMADDCLVHKVLDKACAMTTEIIRLP